MTNVNVNVKKRRRMSTVIRIGGAGGRRNVRPCRMQLRTVPCSDLPIESGDGSGTFINWRQRVQSWCRDTDCNTADVADIIK